MGQSLPGTRGSGAWAIIVSDVKWLVRVPNPSVRWVVVTSSALVSTLAMSLAASAIKKALLLVWGTRSRNVAASSTATARKYRSICGSFRA